MVRPGERYRHYKGKEIIVNTVCKAPVDVLKGEKAAPWMHAIATDDIKKGEEVVFYLELSDKTSWARPLLIFEEVLGETTKFYRFEKIA